MQFYQPPETTAQINIRVAVGMTLSLLPQELILYLGYFLPNDSLNALIRTRTLFAQLLTPHLYDDEVKFKAKRPEENNDELDPYNLPLRCLNCVGRWHSGIILDYFCARPTHVLTHADEIGRSLLHIAAGGGNAKLSQILISKGLNIEAKDACGTTPLLQAARNAKEAMMDWLLDEGADVTAFDLYNRTVLLQTVMACSGVMVQRVIEAIKKQRTVGQSPNGDIFAPSTGGRVLHAAIFRGDEFKARLLLDNGADASAANSYGTTALAAAAIHGYNKMIHLLLDRGADVLPFDTLGRSALTGAAESQCDWSTVQRLFQATLEAGGDITAGAEAGDGLTPLHYFARQGCMPAVELLINNNADVLARSETGVTALNLALFRYPDNPSLYEDICRLLIETIDRVNGDYDHILPSEDPLTGGTSLHLAAQHGSETLVRLLINSRVDVMALDDKGRSALDLATLSCHEAAAQLLSHEMKSRQLRQGCEARGD
jgi:ankyrin repeat protein